MGTRRMRNGIGKKSEEARNVGIGRTRRKSGTSNIGDNGRRSEAIRMCELREEEKPGKGILYDEMGTRRRVTVWG